MLNSTVRQLARRPFLKLLAITGGLAGCGPLLTRQETPTPTLLPVATMALNIRYELENQAIDYGRHPAGCSVTGIEGRIGTSEIPQNVKVHVWDTNGPTDLLLALDATGSYGADVAADLTDGEFNVQVIDTAANSLISDIIIAQAIPQCGLNMMSVNFVAVAPD
jgi:hypothetical protein